MRLLAAILLAVGSCAQELPSLPHGCMEGSCYPATGNLLVGRAHNLTTTSTCGLRGPANYCIVSHLQGLKKCFQCDSRAPYNPDTSSSSHRVENVIYLSDRTGEMTWWQSENGKEKVSIQLDLEAEFHFTHLIIKFKTFRPAAMYIERSADFGRSWNAYRYFAFNCTLSFPNIPTGPLRRIDDTICEHRYSDIEPSTLGEVIYKVLDPAVKVDDPYSLQIQDRLRITNLKIHFTKLHTLGDNLLDGRPVVLKKYYYAIYELVVRGSCFCYGHASECSPVAGDQGNVPGMIQGRCICKHNTQGLNCEQCRDFHHELPWRPARADHPHTCKVCDCNKHSTRCHFDMAVYRATGNARGGVCEDCLHNTMGKNCELCRPYYYRNPAADIRSHNVCIPCDCDPVGSLEGGVCDGDTDLDYGSIGGQCRCKDNVQGARCDRCKDGYYGLSLGNPLGCQACRCDPRGLTMIGSSCDPVSGDCVCKRYVTGRYCDTCLPKYWGLGNDLGGCRPCDCDFGGSSSDRCEGVSGQCDCHPYMSGRQCQQVEPGYYCMPLDLFTYEGEEAKPRSPSDPLPGGKKRLVEEDCMEMDNLQALGIRRRRHRQGTHRSPKPWVEVVRREWPLNDMVTWTGLGFARVRDGAGLTFLVSNIPRAMDYSLLLRYEPESAEDWEAIIKIHTVGLPTTYRCGNLLPHGRPYRLTLHHTERHIMASSPFCFEPNIRYEISIRFQRLLAPDWNSNTILVDSLVLLPQYTELPGFVGSGPAAQARRQDMERYRCLQSFTAAGTPDLADACSRLLCSISALLHHSALPCECDPQGSFSSECTRVGGFCRCKPHVMGRRCDHCSPNTFGFGPVGCLPCECSAEGSVDGMCDADSGACSCRSGVRGRRCDRCFPDHWGFPACRPCRCNGHALECDAGTGYCRDCMDHTGGRHCERCVAGYYGDPVLGSGQQCRPCPCPDYPESGHYHGVSCHADLSSSRIVCLCETGYTGSRCDECAAGYYGNPAVVGSQCWPCECNNNIDVTDRASCDPQSGRCLACLYNTGGAQCSDCRPGYYGNALQQDCRRCICNVQGTLTSLCDADGLCHCDRAVGQCSCRPHVVGASCDQCAVHYWNFGHPQGCEPCDCHPEHSYALHCNMFTGQCDCRPRFGGRSCSECKKNYWGNPGLRCQACDCAAEGSDTLQCDRATGRCLCRQGFTGARCDQCSRGYLGRFPSCAPCHICFSMWDEEVDCLWERIEELRERLDRALGPEVNGTAHRPLQELEEQLAKLHSLISSLLPNSTLHLYPLRNLSRNLRQELVAVSQRLDDVERAVARTQEANQGAEGEVEELDEMTRNLTAGLAQKTRELEKYIKMSFKEYLAAVRAAYWESGQAEQRVNETVWGAMGPLQESVDTRQRAEGLLQQHQDQLPTDITAHSKELRELQLKVHNMSMDNINKVCGGSGSCADPCGGGNCRDDEGRRQCGGPGCGGAVSSAEEAMRTANNVSRATQDMERLLRTIDVELAVVQNRTDRARDLAMDTLARAAAARQQVNITVGNLRSFITALKDFLNEEGADPSSIDLVAGLVLDITLPFEWLDAQRIMQDIELSLDRAQRVETILKETGPLLRKAEQLRRQAEKARIRAVDIQDKVNQTVDNIEAAKDKLDQAEGALEAASYSTDTANDAVNMVSELLSAVETQLNTSADRMGNLTTGVQALQNKTSANRELVQEVKRAAQDVLNRTQQLEAGDWEEVQQRYRELKDKVDAAGSGGEGEGERAKRLQEEAEELRKRAARSLERLDALQSRFERNEQVMVQKTEQLQALEGNVTELLQHIRERSQYYGSCS